VSRFTLSHLRELEAESVFIFREAVAECESPVLLYSVGKDSSVLLHLARKAFRPGPIPFPALHVDTSFKFREMYEFRDRICRDYGVELLVHRNEEALARNGGPESWSCGQCADLLKTQALVAALRQHGFDAAFGGARRDEEASRAKERVFSFRDRNMQWDPRRPTPRTRRGSPCGSSRCRTGPSWTSGTTSMPRGSRSSRSTSRPSAPASGATACSSWPAT
jgi:sulfate adenylyltransferase subunit 2